MAVHSGGPLDLSPVDRGCATLVQAQANEPWKCVKYSLSPRDLPPFIPPLFSTPVYHPLHETDPHHPNTPFSYVYKPAIGETFGQYFYRNLQGCLRRISTGHRNMSRFPSLRDTASHLRQSRGRLDRTSDTGSGFLGKFCKGDDNLMVFLDPTIKILSMLSATLKEGTGLVSHLIHFLWLFSHHTVLSHSHPRNDLYRDRCSSHK